MMAFDMSSAQKKAATVAVLFRVLSAILIDTWFVPDEYWQSMEVAHQLVFGYGHLTWEWRLGIRSVAYPLLFSPFYFLVKILSLDSFAVLTVGPRIVQALFTAYGDYNLYCFAFKVWNARVAKCTLYCHLLSWFSTYCGARTLANTMEMALFCVALRHFPWKEYERQYKVFVILSGVMVVLRPTAIILLAPLGLRLLFKVDIMEDDDEDDKVKEKRENNKYRDKKEIKRLRLLKIKRRRREEEGYLVIEMLRDKIRCVMLASIVAMSLVIVDFLLNGLFLGNFQCSMWSFIDWNVIRGIGSFYGTHPWYWYVFSGLPAILGLNFIPFVLGIFRRDPSHTFIFCVILWTISVYSFFPHKEFRFILPLLPLVHCVCGHYMDSVQHKVWFSTLLFVVFYNIAITIYVSWIHQRGTIDVMEWLHGQVREREHVELLFIMPCHSTPLYSHLHKDVPLRFLTCEPNLKKLPDYQEEADVFYSDPKAWLKGEWNNPSHVIFFDELLPKLQGFLVDRGLASCAHFHHTHFPEGRVSESVLVYCR